MRFLLPLILLTLTACTTKPITVMNNSGAVMRGSYTASLAGGTFKVCRGALVCTGVYNFDTNASGHLTFPVFCNNGLQGNAAASIESNGNGYGKVTFNNGTTLDFVFGNIADSL